MFRVSQSLAVLLLLACLFQAATCATDEFDECGEGCSREFVKGSCTKVSWEGVSDEITMTKCRKPRPTVVRVTSSNPALVMQPQAVLVNRCEGHCTHHKSCVAINTHRVNKTASWYDPIMKQHLCGEIEVEEHLNCGCTCTIKLEDCSEHQVYKKNLCMCKCKNEVEMRKCESTEGRKWNHALCHCECRAERSCSSGFEWIPSRCNCGMVMKVGDFASESREGDINNNNIGPMNEDFLDDL